MQNVKCSCRKLFLHIWVVAHVNIHPTQGSQAYFLPSKGRTKNKLDFSKMQSDVNGFNPSGTKSFKKKWMIMISMMHVSHLKRACSFA